MSLKLLFWEQILSATVVFDLFSSSCILSTFDKHDKTQLLAKFKKILEVGFRRTSKNVSVQFDILPSPPERTKVAVVQIFQNREDIRHHKVRTCQKTNLPKKKELGEYPAIFTSHLVLITHIFTYILVFLQTLLSNSKT